jgi:hypothetical protein
VDLIEQQTDRMRMVEAKSGETIANDSFDSMEALEKLLINKSVREKIEKQLEYGGSEAFVHNNVRVVPWNAL